MIWFSIAVLVVGVTLLALKKSPRPTRPRAGSSVSQRDFENPFNDPNDLELDSTHSKPTLSRTGTGELESGVRGGGGGEEVKEMRRGQGLLGKLFGGLPEGTIAAGTTSRPRGNSSVSTRRAVGGEISQSERRRQDGVERLDDRDHDQDSVLGAESERMEAVELDDVDGLSKYGTGQDEEEEDWGEFEKATGATKVVQQNDDGVDDDSRRHK